MKKEEYLSQLKFRLIDLPAKDLEQIEDFYEELILDGIEQGASEEEILARLESPEQAADKIRAEYGGIVVYTAKVNGSDSESPNNYESSDPIHTIHIEAENLRIRVRTAESGAVRALFKPRDGRDKVTFEEKDGIFFLHHEMKGGLFQNWLNLFLEFNILILEVPVDFPGTMELKTTNGSIRAAGLSSLSKAELISSNGRIRVENSQIDTLAVQAGNGKIEAANIIGTSMEASTENGIITVKECRFPKKLSLITQNGAVTGRNLISDDLVLQTYNGFVTGTIIGNQNDYNISSVTRNGFNNLESVYDTARSKTLTARTHNGRIQIDFTL